MLLVAKRETVEEVQAVFAKWDLDAVVIGHVTEGGRINVKFGGQVVVDLPVQAVVDLCPAYRRTSTPPPPPKTETSKLDLPPPKKLNQAFLRILASPTIADKEWVWRQYDHMVHINTFYLPGADAAVLRLKGQGKALAMTLDGNSLYTYLDPRAGGKIAVAEACRNLACLGAKPIGVTNCLNFGNPEKPEVMWQFEEVINGMVEACEAFSIPVTGGNVSFYNDTEGASIYPTPVIGVVGIVSDSKKTMSPGFKGEGDPIVLLGENKEELGGSEYLRTFLSLENGIPPAIDLELEKKVQKVCLKAIENGLLRSAHDTSEGGLAVCLAECAFLGTNQIGCEVELKDDIRADALLFGETQSRIVVSLKKGNLKKLLALAEKMKVNASVIGKTGGTSITIRRAGRELVRVPVKVGRKAWKNAIPESYRIK